MNILRKLTLATALAAGLAGCGNDASRTAGSQAALGAAKGVVGSIRGRLGGADGATTATQPNLPALIGKALEATDGPVMIMAIEATNATVVMAPVATNGAVVTWKTSDKRSFAFKRGVLVSTRGFGSDLMSAKADQAIALITARRAGQARRTFHYLGGTGQTTEMTLDCTFAPSAPVRVAVGHINTMATPITELCTRDGLTVQNAYWVDGRGVVLKSRQWVGQALGYVVTQQLRP